VAAAGWFVEQSGVQFGREPVDLAGQLRVGLELQFLFGEVMIRLGLLEGRLPVLADHDERGQEDRFQRHAMRVLGWYIIAGAVLAAAIEQLSMVLLFNSLVTPPPEGIDSVAFAAVGGLVPVPALAGAALLTFARIVRLGAAMDDELQGTV
jgi:uncharacterized membrane protein YhfC